jgi:DNA invertase Pin-like site-specific DNA recombinase
MNMIYGYARVSSKGQALHGNSLEEQLMQLRNSGCSQVIEEQYSAKEKGRPIFEALLKRLQPGDTLIVTKLDRFARNTREGLEVVQYLVDMNITFKILNMGTFDNTPQGKMSMTMFLAFAEFEREMIIQRTAEGRAIARKKEGYQEGRPKKFSKKQLDHAISILSVNGGNHSYKEVDEITGISKSTLIRENNKRKGIKL